MDLWQSDLGGQVVIICIILFINVIWLVFIVRAVAITTKESIASAASSLPKMARRYVGSNKARSKARREIYLQTNNPVANTSSKTVPGGRRQL